MSFRFGASLRARARRYIAVLGAILVIATTATVVSPSLASADLGDPGQITLQKMVDGQKSAPDLIPGDTFVYGLLVGCDDNPCIGAHVTDQLPEELAGFELQRIQVEPASSASATLTGCEAGSVVTSDCVLDVTLTESLGEFAGEPVIGIHAGQTVRVSIVLAAPVDLTPSWAYNGVPIVNEAYATAANSQPRSDSASVTISIETETAVNTTKQWAANSIQFSPGASMPYTITGANQSNIAATTLTLQDPAEAPDGATSLAASNPYNYVDFVDLCAPSVLPAGADQVQVDAYVRSGGVWNWVSGVPGATASAPAVSGDIGGLRFIYTSTSGATIAPDGSAAQQCVTNSLRATHRESGAALVTGATVPNTVAASLDFATDPSVDSTASSSITVAGLTVDVDASKTILPDAIAAGDSFGVTIGAINRSNGPLTSLVITEPAGPGAFLNGNLSFAGFTNWAWPSGATAGTFVWFFADGTESAPIVLAPDSTAPATPVGDVAGFTAEFTGAINPGSGVTMSFAVDSDPTMIPDTLESEVFVNGISASGTNGAGTDTDTATDDIEIHYPVIDLELDKIIRPALVNPGGSVLVELPAHTAANRPTVRPNVIEVTEVWDGTADTDFWDAFTPAQISFTDVPADAELEVYYATGDPASPTWTSGQSGITSLYDQDLATLVAPASVGDVIGLRFVFTAVDGFAQGTQVKPNIVFTARDTLRSGGPVTPTVNTTERFNNVAIAQSEGAAGSVPVLSPVIAEPAHVDVISYGTGPGQIIADKDWVGSNWTTPLLSLPSQSASTARTVHRWGVTTPGFDSVTISDPTAGDEANPGDSVFQAFDLLSLPSISFAQDPLLRWDHVAQIELFMDGAWQIVPAPGGSWMNASGFKGYSLSSAQQAAATGVRVRIEPNDAARLASSEPGRPDAGSGIASGAAGRPLRMQWRLRNVVRVPDGSDRWATSNFAFNGGDGAIINEMDVAGLRGGTSLTRTVQDNITLQDPLANVGIDKSVTPTELVVPYPGDVDPANLPTAQFNIDAWNASSARASYVRVTDPVLCDNLASCVNLPAQPGANPFASKVYDPETNPFERLDLTGISFTIASGVPLDWSTSMVTLWRYDGENTSTETMTMTAAVALSAAKLADVVGVSVVYQGASPESNGGLIPRGSSSSNVMRMTLDTRLRSTIRSNGDYVSGGTSITNQVFAQSYDPVVDPVGTPHGTGETGLVLRSAGLDIVATKTVNPTSIVETNADTPITVTLAAHDGFATMAAETVTISDTTPEFWARFELSALGSVTRPAGADLVRVDVQINGDTDWITGTAAPLAALPDALEDPALVTGIRVVFLNDPVRPFSAVTPSADWAAEVNFTVVLRDGAVFPSTVNNTVSAEATHRGHPTVNDTDPAVITLTPGVPRIDVAKWSNPGGSKVVEPGVAVPWQLEFTNTGTSYLDNLRLRDDLGGDLEWDGGDIVIESSLHGELSDVVIELVDADTMWFTFPDGYRMAPGEMITVDYQLILRPGLLGHEWAENEFRVIVDQTFATGACTNTSGNGEGLLGDLDTNECGSSNWVQPQGGALLMTGKSVRGEIDGALVDGASHVQNPNLPCVPNADGYYRGSCVAHTVIGATDEWRLDAVNTGTVPYTHLTFVDPLPTPGDRMLATGGTRGSQWRPVFDLDFGVVGTNALPAGTVATISVTTAPAPCVGTGAGSTWGGDPTCASNPGPESWTELSAYSGDPAAITALRIDLDFTNTAGGSLAPGGTVGYVYRTANPARSEADLPTADAVEPVLRADGSRQVAWNQSGVHAQLIDGGRISRAPERAGVQLFAGAIEIAKTASGDAVDSAPGTIDFSVACTVPGPGIGGVVAVDMGTMATVSVPVEGSVRVDGIPLGAECTVTESGALGAHGETVRTPNGPQAVTVDTVVQPDDDVPGSLQIAVDNRYDLGAMTITKVVDAAVNPAVDFGPWTFDLVCTTAYPTPTEVYAGSFTLSLSTPSWTLPEDTVPAHASCVLTERDAETVHFDGAGVIDHDDGSATITVGLSTAVTVTNSYAVGVLEVEKLREGEGAVRYGDGPFEVAALCRYDATMIYSGSVRLDADNGYRAIFGHEGEPAQLPAGTECDLSETRTAGATGEPVFLPSEMITIAGGLPGEGPGDPTVAQVINTFDTGEITVTKLVEGLGAEHYGAGPFQIRLQCSYDRDGEPTMILWDGVNYLEIELSDANGYQAVLDDVLIGSTCEVVAETVQGGATSVALGQAVTVPGADEEPVTITVTNTFEAGDLEIVKSRIGNAVDDRGAGPFTMAVACMAVIDGETVNLAIPGGASVVLSADNGYRATVSPLPLGAECAVVETDSGGADRITYDPADGRTEIGGDHQVVTVINQFGDLDDGTNSPVDPPAGSTDGPTPAPSGLGRLPRTGAGRAALLGGVSAGVALIAAGLRTVRYARQRRMMMS